MVEIMRHIVLTFGLCGLLLAGLTNGAGGQPNEKDGLAPYRLAGLDGGNAARGKAVFESDPSELPGSILRIDVDRQEGGKPYAIADSNPYRNSAPPVRPEIWALRFRMPWRFSFGSTTADLWVGDVGQDLFEKVTIARTGENHGWNVYEGFMKFSDKYRRQGETYTPPVMTYRRTPQKIASFGVDALGELLLIGYEGTISRLMLDQSDFGLDPRKAHIKLVGNNAPASARVGVIGGDGKSCAPAGAAIRKTKRDESYFYAERFFRREFAAGTRQRSISAAVSR